MAGIFPTDREAEASEVLYTMLSVERIKDAGTSIEETSKTEDNASPSTVQQKQHRIVKKSSNALEKSNSKSQMHLGKTSEEPPFASENEDADEIMNSNADESLVVNGSEQERELTCEETEQHRKTIPKKKCGTKRKQKQVKSEGEASFEPTRLEDNAVQVLERFKRGCECQDDQCFRGLNPESVYRHRLNIAELTKAEHDMYLLGVTMACLTNPSLTARHTERRRLRAQYVYQGRRVCLDAFLYLENCTHYQMKRIRKHLVTHGVTPRVHGNCGKVPHNTFSLDIYKIATEFLKSFISKQEAKQKASTKQGSLHLASDMTRKTVHDLYSKYCRKLSPSIKIMGYSTFRRFMKVQFPQVKFAKVEFVVKGQVGQNQNSAKGGTEERDNKDKSGGKKDLVPLVIANSTVEQNGAYLFTPVNKLQEGVSYQLTSDGFLVKSSTAQFTVVNNRCPE